MEKIDLDEVIYDAANVVSSLQGAMQLMEYDGYGESQASGIIGMAMTLQQQIIDRLDKYELQEGKHE